MKKEYLAVISLMIVTMLIVPQYVVGSNLAEYEVDFNYPAIGDNNETQNRLDETTESNLNTWDPAPRGVYVGGFTKESRLAVSTVPDDDFSISLATVVSFTADSIMSGSSYFTMRLPVHSGDWQIGYVSIYDISADSNWTFEQNITPPGSDLGEAYNDCKINFTRGDHYLVYWSRWFSPDDLSPTDNNDHWTRSNRTYLTVNAPIYPNRFYLIVTHIKYESDTYVDIFLQPDSLSMGTWNRSTVAIYNSEAPDLYDLEVTNLNISFGYSFDFIRGVGEGMSGYNKYIYPGDGIHFLHHIGDVNLDSYISFMFPFMTSQKNSSITVEISFVYYPTGGFWTFIDDTSEWNDFILLSSTSTIYDDLPAGWKDAGPPQTTFWDGWLDIWIQFHNESRYRFFMSDMVLSNDTGFNISWGDSIFFESNWIHIPDFNWQPMKYFMYNHTSVEWDVGHWQIQHVIQQNNYYWEMNVPPAPVDESAGREWEDMDWLEKSFYVAGHVLIVMGDLGVNVIPPWGEKITEYGMAMVMIAKYVDLPTLSGWISDGLNWAWDKIKDFGAWVYKVGQDIIGAVSWFVDQLIYYGSIILAILILALSIVIAFFLFYAPAKLAMALIAAFRFRGREAVGHIQDLSATVGKVGGR